MFAKKISANPLARSKRGVSTIISTIIITGTLLIILAVASFASANVLDLQIANTEFEQAKTNMLTLDQVIQDVALRRGSGGYVQFNQRSGGIGINVTTQKLKILGPPILTNAILTFRPNANGTYQNWGTFGTGSSHWGRTSDQNDATGVNVTGSTSTRETVNLQDTSQTGTINSVTAYIRAKISGGGGGDEKGCILWRTYNTNYESADFTIDRNVFANYSEIRTTNPNTGLTWAWAEVNALEIGSRATTLGSGEALQVSEFWIFVNFTSMQPDLIYQSDNYLVGILYRGGSKVSGTDLDLRGTNNLTVSMADPLGYVRVAVDNGLKIKLDYYRIRLVQNTTLFIGGKYYNFTEITFINIINGTMGGTDTVNFKVQNIEVNTYTKEYDSNDVTIYVQLGTGPQVSVHLFSPPSSMKTAIIFTEVKILVSTS